VLIFICVGCIHIHIRTTRFIIRFSASRCMYSNSKLQFFCHLVITDISLQTQQCQSSPFNNVTRSIQERAKLCLLTLHLNQHDHNHRLSCFKYNTTCRYHKPDKPCRQTELLVNNMPVCDCPLECVNDLHQRCVFRMIVPFPHTLALSISLPLRLSLTRTHTHQHLNFSVFISFSHSLSLSLSIARCLISLYLCFSPVTTHTHTHLSFSFTTTVSVYVCFSQLMYVSIFVSLCLSVLFFFFF
jgi:hypothetical protein